MDAHRAGVAQLVGEGWLRRRECCHPDSPDNNQRSQTPTEHRVPPWVECYSPRSQKHRSPLTHRRKGKGHDTDRERAEIFRAFFLMEDVVGKLGGIVTLLPIGPENPGATAGPTFELFYDAACLLPSCDAAWQLITGRLSQPA